MPDDGLCLPSAAFIADEPHATRPVTLADLPKGTRAKVRGIRAGAQEESAELALRLVEIGFIEGEPLRVIAHGYPGNDPIAVRIGGTTFALRRFEAQCVLVSPDRTSTP
jgi:ferrous iron transport protein A